MNLLADLYCYGELEKIAAAIEDDGSISGVAERALAATVGRVNAIPAAVILDPTSPIKFIKGMSREEAQRVVDMMDREHPEELKGTVVHVGGGNTLSDMKRLVGRQDRNVAEKAIGIATAIPTGFYTALGRADHYNPTTDTVVSYSGNPHVLSHELGHAADFNKDPSVLRRQAGLLYGLGSDVPGVAVAGMAHSLKNEFEATNRAIKATTKEGGKASGDEARNVLLPAYGTYVGAGVGSVLALASLISKKKIPLAVYGALPVAGALAGHIAARAYNALTKEERQKQGAEHESLKKTAASRLRGAKLRVERARLVRLLENKQTLLRDGPGVHQTIVGLGATGAGIGGAVGGPAGALAGGTAGILGGGVVKPAVLRARIAQIDRELEKVGNMLPRPTITMPKTSKVTELAGLDPDHLYAMYKAKQKGANPRVGTMARSFDAERAAIEKTAGRPIKDYKGLLHSRRWWFLNRKGNPASMKWLKKVREDEAASGEWVADAAGDLATPFRQKESHLHEGGKEGIHFKGTLAEARAELAKAREGKSLLKTAEVLTIKTRDALPEKVFALPDRRYPIHDASHARAALSMVAKHGTPAEQAKVRAAVHARYPEIGALEKTAFAPGLPDKKKTSPVRLVEKPEHWRMVLQHHPAVRAGAHHDVRLNDPSSGISHSWATKKDWPKPGERIRLFQQPDHKPSYSDFQGHLLSGYGKTKPGSKGVQKVMDERVEIKRTSDKLVRFDVFKKEGELPDRYVLVKAKHDGKGHPPWVLINHGKAKVDQAPTK